MKSEINQIADKLVKAYNTNTFINPIPVKYCKNINLANKVRKLCEDKGCTPKLYEELEIGPITFQTTVSFKKEVRESSMIIVNPRITSMSEDCKKWSSQSDIMNATRELCALIVSNGAFMDHVSRKVAPPPKELQEKWKLLLEID